MFPTDHFFGSYEFETDCGRDDKGFYARALGMEARSVYSQEQALNDLNAIVDDAIASGKVTPSMGT